MIKPVPSPVGRPLILAVTGTNGKTTVGTVTLQLLKALGWRSAGYDSTGITDVEGVLHKPLIRRSPWYLPEMIAYQVRDGAQAVSLEAFVGLLSAGMFRHVQVDTAVCTGLELDHLDVHKSPEAYWAAKLSLFESHLRPEGAAIMPTDCKRGDSVRSAVERRGARLITVGRGGDVWFEPDNAQEGRLAGMLRIHQDSFPVTFPFTHAITVTNTLLAATAVVAAGGAPPAVADALAQVTPPPGRLQTVGRAGGITVMVDTAHNPGALRTALTSVRGEAKNRVLVVLGAGGERDRQKRPVMGRIAAGLADLVVLTDDNPRREPPARIRSEVRTGCPDCIEIPRRADAIAAAVQMARPGDVVLVTGKGDETTQVIGSEHVAHDDREVIRRVLASLTD